MYVEIDKELTSALSIVFRHLHNQRLCLWKQGVHYLNDTQFPQYRQPTSMHGGLNIY